MRMTLFLFFLVHDFIAIIVTSPAKKVYFKKNKNKIINRVATTLALTIYLIQQLEGNKKSFRKKSPNKLN